MLEDIVDESDPDTDSPQVVEAIFFFFFFLFVHV
jgi:hypothetical protein